MVKISLAIRSLNSRKTDSPGYQTQGRMNQRVSDLGKMESPGYPFLSNTRAKKVKIRICFRFIFNLKKGQNRFVAGLRKKQNLNQV